MSIPVFNVPSAPGVPPMVRNLLSNVATVQGVVAGVQNTIQFFQGAPPLPQWGIFDSNFNSVLDADSILSFGDKNSANVSDFPIQGGTFASYNKVITPRRRSVRVSKTGSLTDRQNFIRQIEALFVSTDVVTIVTPEKTYLSVNLEDYEIIRRDFTAAFALWDVDLFFREVKDVSVVYTTTGTVDTTNAQNAQDQGSVNQGIQQPGTPDPGAQAKATNILAGGPPS